MTSRERVKMLLNKQIPDRMGLFEHYWPETIGQNWIKQGYPEGISTEDHFGYDIQNVGGWFASESFPGRYEVVQETDEWRVAKDGRGASLKYWKAKSGTPEHIDFDVVDPEVWKVYREPLLATDPSRLGDMAATKAGLEAAKAAGKFTVYGNLFVFELMRATIGDQNFLPAMKLDPDWIRDFCQVYLDFYRRHYEILFREAGVPDGMFIYEDYGYRNGLFCSPKTMAELVMPYEKQLVSFFKDYNLPVIVHSCGDIRKAIPLIIEAGFDCLQPMEAKAGCDVVEIAREYGNKLAYMGNINVVALGTNDPEQVKAEIVPKLTELKKMRIPYFFHSDHSVPPDVTYDTYRYAMQLFHDNAAYDV